MTIASGIDLDPKERFYYVLCKNCLKARSVAFEKKEYKELSNKDDIRICVSVCPFCGNEGVFEGPDIPFRESKFERDVVMLKVENIELRGRLKRTQDKLEVMEGREVDDKRTKDRLRYRVHRQSEELRKLADMVHTGNQQGSVSSTDLRREPKDRARLPYR